ncbi:hypothetical protein [Acutalibacter caecimuris]|uniref:hypothetical protein n=1 Tax=Acutalibacter caecimuris TaxID=3093657 RepID=UPI002AC9BB19|nr:hypothetical protein [Acutalibacter sp. M00118]
MQYCEKCRRACPNELTRCPACRSQKLRPLDGQDMVFLCGCDMYTAQQLHTALEEAGIPSKMEDAGQSYFSFDSDSMPTDQKVYVPFEQLEQANDLAAQVSRQVESERSGKDGAQPASPPTAKRIVGEVLSIVAFLVLIMLAVYGADGFANWLKSLLGIG